ncbi:MAG: carboxypeptidase-like regulatory domain-containing protein [Proteobacteria bacterium]|nr:carboxypeptidase-like regulatory domain-containing protein [Pseudomonadota bacterium]
MSIHFRLPTWMYLLFLITPLVSSCIPLVPPGSPETGYTITGFVGESSQVPAPNETVFLLDGQTEKPLTSVGTNFFGKYTFAALPPGLYILQVRNIKWGVLIKDQSERLDIDLSAPGGKMNYLVAPQTKQAAEAAPAKPQTGEARTVRGKTGQSGADGGSGDKLQQLLLSSAWCSFSFKGGSQYSSTSSSRVRFFTDGTYAKGSRSEGSYTGKTMDDYGNTQPDGSLYGSQTDSGGDGRWEVTHGQLFMSEGNGSMELVDLVIKYNSNGSPILKAEGKEYCRCD